MEEQIKRKKEIVVIFKKSGLPSRTIYYKPIDIEIGYLDEATNLFVTKNGEEYHYLLNMRIEYSYEYFLVFDLVHLKV